MVINRDVCGLDEASMLKVFNEDENNELEGSDSKKLVVQVELEDS